MQYQLLINILFILLISSYVIGHLLIWLNQIRKTGSMGHNYYNRLSTDIDPFGMHKKRFDDENDWSVLQNRDINIYILPNTRTVILEPDDICYHTVTFKNVEIFLLIVVITSVDDFSRRKLIRNTWGNYGDYLKSSSISNYIKARYEKFNDSAFALLADKKFDPTYLPDNFTYDPKSYDEDEIMNPDFKVVFLTGIQKNKDSYVQYQLENEIEVYKDVIQENFVDTYRNLTLKSLMMLKWVKNNCVDTARYILKIDDDMYVNMPNLMRTLRRKAAQFDATAMPEEKEYLMLGYLHRGLGPSYDAYHRLYTPYYLFSGTKYPRYLSGKAGYVMSMSAAIAIFKAAQKIPYLNMEDVFITGLCTQRSQPRVKPSHDYMFVNHGVPAGSACDWHHIISAEQRHMAQIQSFHERGMRIDETNRCEIERLFQRDNNRLLQIKKDFEILIPNPTNINMEKKVDKDMEWLKKRYQITINLLKTKLFY